MLLIGNKIYLYSVSSSKIEVMIKDKKIFKPFTFLYGKK